MIKSTRGLSVSGAERRWLKVFRTLNEFQARLFAADKALDLGRGGISRLAALTGLSRTTITKAGEELRSSGKLADPGEGRVRRVGGGRKKVEEVDPEVRELLEKMLQETTAGDPMSLLRWTSKSTRTMAAELTRLGHPVTWVTVARCVDDMGYSLQANRKEKEGPQHANRDAQFRCINRQVKALLGSGDPVISVDAKKKQLVGRFKNAGRTCLCPLGPPRKECASQAWAPTGLRVRCCWGCDDQLTGRQMRAVHWQPRMPCDWRYRHRTHRAPNARALHHMPES